MREHLWKLVTINSEQKVTGSIPGGDTKFCYDGSSFRQNVFVAETKAMNPCLPHTYLYREMFCFQIKYSFGLDYS